MDANFDPYHHWLSIPPEEQPAHHYRLLGLEPFEDNADVIDIAANRFSNWVKTESAKQHAAAGDRILTEIRVARSVLLNPAQKIKYDEALDEQRPRSESSKEKGAGFDPYHSWLGISPTHQPPTHYRLLGLSEFEAQHDIIKAAASRQTAYLHTAATGAHRKDSQRLLNEVAKARLCLLNEQQRTEYDRKLRRQRSNRFEQQMSEQLTSSSQPTKQTPHQTSRPAESQSPRTPKSPAATATPQTDSHSSAKREDHRQPTRNRSRTTSFQMRALGGAAAAVVLVVILSFAFRPEEPDAADASSVTSDDSGEHTIDVGTQATNDAAVPEQPELQTTEYQSLITGSFAHRKSAIENDGLPFWLYGSPAQLTSGQKYPLVIVLHQLRKDAASDEMPNPQDIARAWSVRDGMQANWPCFVVQPYLAKNTT